MLLARSVLCYVRGRDCEKSTHDEFAAESLPYDGIFPEVPEIWVGGERAEGR